MQKWDGGLLRRSNLRLSSSDKAAMKLYGDKFGCRQNNGNLKNILGRRR